MSVRALLAAAIILAPSACRGTEDAQPRVEHIGRPRHAEVVLEATTSPGGALVSLQVLRGNPLLEQAAIEAGRRWRYEPLADSAELRTAVRTFHFRIAGRRSLLLPEYHIEKEERP